MNRSEEPAEQSWVVDAMSREYSTQASAEDIFFCFRLILGRHPDSGEWLGHALQIGHDLEKVVASYLNSLEFSRRRLTQTNKSRSVQVANLNRFQIYADPQDPIIGSGVINGSYEPEIVTLFEQILQPQMGVLDIGANIGYFSMLAASLVGPNGFVLAVEPNPANARMLEASRQLNGFDQITILQAAASSKVGLLTFHATHSTGVTSPIPPGDQTISDDSLVPCLPIDQIISVDRKIDLIKIDVDGSEYHALNGVKDLIKRDHPIILTEFYPGGLLGLSGIDGYAYLQWLAGLGYRLAIVEPDGSTSAIDNPDEVARVLEARGGDHLDLICLPLAQELTIETPDGLSQDISSKGTTHEELIRTEQRCRDFETELDWVRRHLQAANLHARDAESRARDAESRVRDAGSRAGEAAKELMVASIRSAAAEGAMNEMRKALEAANNREREVSSLLAAFQTSTSWQLTGPLRSGVGLLRRVRAKIVRTNKRRQEPVEPVKAPETPSASLSEVVNPERYKD